MENLLLTNIKPRNSKTEFIKSKFNFINSHNGLHKGHLHVLLGRTNKGKSALILEIIIENAINHVKSLLYLSEGHKQDIRSQVDEILNLKKIAPEKHESILNNILIADESDLKGNYNEEPEFWINALTRYSRTYSVDLLFIDNISGLKYGNSSPDEQVRFVKYLNDSAIRENIAIFLAVHQAKSVDHLKELELQDVRANQNFTSIPSYVYALNDFANLERNKRIVRVLKSRNYGDAIDKYFELFFKSVKKSGFYQKDREISQKIAKSIFSINSKLSNTNSKKY